MYRPRGTSIVSLLAVTSALVLTSCIDDDGRSGIPIDTPRAASTPRFASTTVSSTTTSSTTTQTKESTTEAAAVSIGAVPSNPAAAAALQQWGVDFVAGDNSVLTRKCWTLAPLNIREMYSDKAGILAAIAQPGVDGQFAVTWRGPDQTVSVKRSEIASGYACPRVYPTGSNGDFNTADARHTVRRYLSRWIGKPVNPADVEGEYPLVCDSSTTWDPTGTGDPVAAPLANNPGRLTGTTAFDDAEITSEALQGDYVSVFVPVTNSAGVTSTRTFTLSVGTNGYCIGDVTP